MSTQTPTWSTKVDQGAESVTMVPLSRIRIAPDNPRQEVGDVSELTESIKQQGIIEPLILTHGPDDTYLIVAGYRRMAAIEKIVKEEPGRLGSVQRRQLAHVPAIIRTYDEQARTVVGLVENLQRADLSPLEEAHGYERLVGQGLSQRVIAEQVGKAQSHVQKRLALLELPAPALKALDSGGITIAAALELAKLKDLPDYPKAVFRIIEDYPGEGLDADEVKYAVENEIRESKARQRYDAANAELQRKGVKVLSSKNWNGWFRSQKDRPLAGQGQDQRSRLSITFTQHAKQPCHAARIDREGRIVYVCTQPANHAKEDKQARALSAEQRRDEAAKKKQREQGKWRTAAAAARLEVLKQLAARPSSELIQWAAIRLADTVRHEEGRVAVQVLGLTPGKSSYGSPTYGEPLAREARRSQRAAESVLVAIAFGNIEPRIQSKQTYVAGAGSWGRPDAEDLEYLALLRKAGYKPAPADQSFLAAKVPAGDQCLNCKSSIENALELAMIRLPEAVIDAYETRKAERKLCVNCWTTAHQAELGHLAAATLSVEGAPPDGPAPEAEDE